MKKIAGFTFLSLIAGLSIYFHRPLVSAVRNMLSPVIAFEEDICSRVGGPAIAFAEYSLDAGHTWQPAAGGKEVCSAYIQLGAGPNAHENVFLHLQRADGQYELWQVTAGSERRLSASPNPIAVETAVPSTEGGSARDTLDPGKGGWGGLIAVVLVLGVSFLLQTHRQTRLLEEIRRTGEQTNFLLQKSQRKEVELSTLPGGVTGWIASRVQEGFGVYPDLDEAAVEVLERFPMLYLTSLEGHRIVISPHPKKALLRQLGVLAPRQGMGSRLGRLSHELQAVEVVRRGRVVRHSLGVSGETFDIEARLLAEALDFNWDQPDFLYFFGSFKAKTP
jgi:hypothetical protein